MQTLEAQLEDKVDREFIVKALAKLSAVYGHPRDRTPELARIMVVEWVRLLEPYPKDVAQEAFEAHISKSKFWPVPAEIIERCAQGVRDKREHVGYLRRELLPPAPAREPEVDRASPEEMKRREEVIARVHAAIRVQYPYTPVFDAWADQISEPAPASQGGPTPYLLNSRAAKRARGESAE